MKTEELRQNFIEYFKKQGHTLIPSSSVIPHDDPTLLFINAGMNQFKDVFLGKSERDYSRAVTIQKCIRAGGKHNDLENVGHTARHLTFFEMLGNFSFGDYFKKEAIQFAWEVSTQVFGFDPDRIWPSVFREDDEAFELWTKYVPKERITRFDEKDNFWAMGDTGPCGPCSELYYDRGSEYSSARNPKEDEAGLRFLEFWNLVFMQFNRSADGTLTPLPKPSIDTGAGLERVISLKMNVDSVFETDVLRGMIAKVEEISGVTYDLKDHARSPAFRVIADHLRCLSFAIADGAQPSNVERGYVLRKILRRTVRYGRILGLEEPFLAKVLPSLIELMGRDYPELVKAEKRIAEILTNEEEAFIRTLRRGGNILTQIIEHSQSQGNQITGEDAFKLKDTYGLPLDEILLIAKDSELTVDLPRFQELEKEARERSKTAKKVIEQQSSENLFSTYIKNFGASQFLGFDQSTIEAKVNAIVVNGDFVETMEAGEEGLVILDKTPFYASMGGQIGDQGILEEDGFLFQVTDTVSPYKGVIAHQGKLEQGTLHVGALLIAKIDSERRQRIASNHTATHLLHWALHFILGEHIKQAGSVVEPNRLRFDFNHHKPLTSDEIRKIEDLVNLKIRQNIPVKWYEISYEEALKREDIKQFFGEKYGSQVRVVDADFSKELCGGTHVHALGDIGLFRILKESSIAAGIRRIEAVTALDADLFARESESQLNELAALLKVQPAKLHERVKKLLEDNAEQTQELKELKQEKMKMLVDSLESSIQQVNDISFLAKELAISQEDLRLFADVCIDKKPSVVLVLATKVAEDRCHMIVRVGDVLSKRINALELIKALSPIIEGSGGGKPNMAQAGGKAPKKISEALSKVSEFLLSK